MKASSDVIRFSEMKLRKVNQVLKALRPWLGLQTVHLLQLLQAGTAGQDHVRLPESVSASSPLSAVGTGWRCWSAG